MELDKTPYPHPSKTDDFDRRIHGNPDWHVFGQAFQLPGTPEDVSTSAAAVGTAPTPARADHVHYADPLGFQGAQGAPGSQGAAGAQGNQGAQGSQGAQGTQGSQGTAGSTGTGVNGVHGLGLVFAIPTGGTYFVRIPGQVYALGTGGVTDGTLSLWPVMFSRSFTFDRLCFWLQTNGSAGSKMRLGVYDSDGTGSLPGTVLYDSGQIDSSTGASALLTYTFSWTPTVGHLYYVGAVGQGTPFTNPIVTVAGVSYSTDVFYTTGAMTSAAAMVLTVTGVTGALGNSPTIAAYTSASNYPVIALRVA